MKNQKWKNQINKTLWHQARPSYYWNHREHHKRFFLTTVIKAFGKLDQLPHHPILETLIVGKIDSNQSF